MAMSASIAVNNNNVYINYPIQVVLTVSNSGGAAVNVTGIEPLAYITGATAIDKNACPVALGLPIGTGTNLVVPAGGSTVFTWGANFFAPSGSTTYDVLAIVNSNDGSVFSPAAATVTVTALPLPASEL